MKGEYRRNRFYVGSSMVLNNHWGHTDIVAATDHAKRLLNDERPSRHRSNDDEVFIVKIVRVVKRADRPVVVEDLK